ncbi:MAG: diaminopimelate epimerase [Albidovulum sp.]|nr:diaminopimelate epimerase [Albidovulum sp.]MDE0307980.1 diaminopimelate epimerase [Albidovulum sp.]
MASIAFQKMHGLGNDFVVLDSRGGNRKATPRLARALADRRQGVGFDQLAEITDSEAADARLEFLNADGSASAACGNATRCVARKLMEEFGRSSLVIETERGVLACNDAGNGLTSVNMGQPLFDWLDIPLAEDIHSLSLPLPGMPSAVGFGNPHCVFFVDDCENVDIESEGPKFENHRLFPKGANVEFATVASSTLIRMRIWERGAGVTLASGSGSCATAVAAARRGLAERKVSIRVDGGMLEVDWRDDGVWMTGPTLHVFDAELSPEFLEAQS